MPVPDKSLIPWSSCELLVAFKFSEVGYSVSVPLSPQPYDLVVDTGEVPPRLYRVQVKKSHYVPSRQRAKGKGDRECHRVTLIRRKMTRARQRLQDHEFDYLAVVCNPTVVYVIPVAELREKGGTALRQHVDFKGEADNLRQDSEQAARRWTPYFNNFRL